MRRVHHPLPRAIRCPRVVSQQGGVAPQAHPVPVDAGDHRRADMGHGHAVAVAQHGDEGLSGDLAGQAEAIVPRRHRQRLPCGRFLGQAFAGGDTGGCRGPGVGLLPPRRCLRRQVRVVGEDPPGQEVALDPLDQRLHTALLVARAGVAGLRMHAELPGQLEQSRCPQRLALRVPSAGHRLHVVEDEHPRRPAQLHQAVHQTPEQRLSTACPW